MSNTEKIRARIEPELKHNAEIVLAALGLSVTEALTLFYKQITLQQGLPFDVKIPNDVTIKTLKQVRNREDLTEYSSLDDLKQKFKQQPCVAKTQNNNEQ